MSRIFRLFALALLALAAGIGSGTAHAELRVALVIGNSAYKHVGKLANPLNDAALLASTLRQLQFEVIDLTDVGLIDLKKAIRTFTSKLKEGGPDSVGLVFYAGHGLQVQGINYLVPVDAEIEKEGDVDLYALDVAALMQGLRDAGNRLNVVVLDACRNNPYESGFRALSRGLAPVNAPNGSLIAYATAPGNVAADGDGADSPFSAAIAAEIIRPGASIETIFKRVRERVFAETRGKQLPWTHSSILGDFCPAGCNGAEAPLISAAVARTAPSKTDEAREAWLSVKDSDNERLLRSVKQHYPDSIYAQFATIRIDELRQRGASDVAAPPNLIAAEKHDLGSIEASEHGDYFVIMGSFPKTQKQRLATRLAQLKARKLNAHVIDTNEYPNLADGLYAVVLGPYNRDYAIFKKTQVSAVVADAYVKAGR